MHIIDSTNQKNENYPFQYHQKSLEPLEITLNFMKLTIFWWYWKRKKRDVGLVESIICIMNTSLCTKKLEQKMHHMALIYKLNVLSYSRDISNTRTLRCNNGSCCNLYTFYNDQWSPMLSIPTKYSNIVRTNIICMFVKLWIF